MVLFVCIKRDDFFSHHSPYSLSVVLGCFNSLPANLSLHIVSYIIINSNKVSLRESCTSIKLLRYQIINLCYNTLVFDFGARRFYSIPRLYDLNEYQCFVLGPFSTTLNNKALIPEQYQQVDYQSFRFLHVLIFKGESFFPVVSATLARFMNSQISSFDLSISYGSLKLA